MHQIIILYTGVSLDTPPSSPSLPLFPFLSLSLIISLYTSLSLSLSPSLFTPTLFHSLPLSIFSSLSHSHSLSLHKNELKFVGGYLASFFPILISDSRKLTTDWQLDFCCLRVCLLVSVLSLLFYLNVCCDCSFKDCRFVIELGCVLTYYFSVCVFDEITIF